MMSQAIPNEFSCPLTLQIFEFPLICCQGMNYERAAILEWLDRGNYICPLTRKPLELKGLIQNMSLKQRIEMWRAENGYQERRMESSSAAKGCDCPLSEAGFVTTLPTCLKKDLATTTKYNTPTETDNTKASRRRGRQ
jgi:hypothetical protein